MKSMAFHIFLRRPVRRKRGEHSRRGKRMREKRAAAKKRIRKTFPSPLPSKTRTYRLLFQRSKRCAKGKFKPQCKEGKRRQQSSPLDLGERPTVFTDRKEVS